MSSSMGSILIGPFSVLQGIEHDLESLLHRTHVKEEEEEITLLLVKILEGQREQIISEVIENPERGKIVVSLQSKLGGFSDEIVKRKQKGLSNQSILQCLGQIQEVALQKGKDVSKDVLTVSTDVLRKGTNLQSNAAEEASKYGLFIYINEKNNLSLCDSQLQKDSQGAVIQLNEIDEDLIKKLKSSQIVQLLQKAITTPLPCLTEYLMDLMQKSGEIRERILLFTEKNPQSCENLLVNLTASYNSNVLSILKQLVEKCGFPVTTNLITDCLYYQNLPLLNFVLATSGQVWKEKNAEAILTALLQTLDPNSAEIVFNHFPEICKKCSLDLIKKAVVEGKSDFVRWMLGHGKKIPSTKLVPLIKVAVQLGDLSLIKLLCQHAQSKKNKHSIFYSNNTYSNRLGLENLSGTDKKQARYEKLFFFALNSPMEEVYRLVQKYPEFCDVLPEVIKKTSLLVRLPKDCRSEVNPKFKEIDVYTKSSETYASENLNFIKKNVPAFSQMTRDDFLNSIITDRYSRNPLLDEEYSKKASELPPYVEPTTPLILWEGTGNERVLGFSRYYRSLRHLTGSIYNSQKQAWGSLKGLSLDTGSVPKSLPYKTMLEGSPSLDFIYSLPTSSASQCDKSVLTRLNFEYPELTWHHATSENILMMQPHAEKLHQELVDYKLDAADPESMRIFLEKVARAYKLIATLCEFKRGTPHNAMIYLSAIYAYHGLPPPIPKLEHFFLDNTMLMMPIESVIKNWEILFEPTWDQALVASSDGERREIVKDFLKRNPELWHFSSATVRNDPECILVLKKKKADSKGKE